MTDLQAVTRGRHEGKRWRRSPNYQFAREDTVAVLSVNELPKAMQAMTLAFIKKDEQYQPVAIQGLSDGQNLFVHKDGRWLGSYVPAVYRTYPFRMGRNNEGELLLCMDEASGLLSEDAKDEAFFDAEGKPSAIINNVLRFLQQAESDRNVTRQVCSLFQQHDLIEPWPINVQQEDKPPFVLEGLHRISEAQLEALPPEALVELRGAGGLLAAYCQLLSMQNLAELGKMATARAPDPPATLHVPATPSYDDMGIISFENL